MTLTDDRIIAAAAIIGESSHPNAGYSAPAAMEMPAVLYPKASQRNSRSSLTRPWLAIRHQTASTVPATHRSDPTALKTRRSEADEDSDDSVTTSQHLITR